MAEKHLREDSMGKRQLLFVTYRDEHLEEGVAYAIELAKAMYEDITFLLVPKKRSLMNRIETLMTAVTFAEAGEHDTAREIMAGRPDAEDRARTLLRQVEQKCTKEGISVRIEDTDLDAVAGIRSYLKTHTGIDKVVLSPLITEDGNVTSKDLNRLVRTSSRPIVTMTRQVLGTA
jgi:hypothetical protein